MTEWNCNLHIILTTIQYLWYIKKHPFRYTIALTSKLRNAQTFDGIANLYLCVFGFFPLLLLLLFLILVLLIRHKVETRAFFMSTQDDRKNGNWDLFGMALVDCGCCYCLIIWCILTKPEYMFYSCVYVSVRLYAPSYLYQCQIINKRFWNYCHAKCKNRAFIT